MRTTRAIDHAGRCLISQPWRPTAVTTVAAAGSVYDLRVVNAFEPPRNKAYLYAGSGTGGCAIIDVSDLRAPAVVKTLAVEVSRGLDVERVPLDRVADEDGRQLKDSSHEGSRSFRREEIERILGARF
jgi:hypothetical protein